MENLAVKLENSSLAEYLLDESDFEVICSDESNYLFLSDSLRFFRLTNPKIEDYLKSRQKNNL